jgi:hypothetical protein
VTNGDASAGNATNGKAAVDKAVAGKATTGNATIDDEAADHELYQQPVGLTGLRAGLAWRLRAKSMRCQPPAIRPESRSFGRLVLDGDATAPRPRRTDASLADGYPDQ